MPRPRKTNSLPLLRKRIKSIYQSQKRRAKKYGQALNYCEAELWNLASGEPACYLCEQSVTVKDLCFAHKHAVSRGGSFKLENLAVAHSGCNRAQGVMSCESFKALMDFLGTIPEADAKDCWMRLKAGGAWAAGWRG